MDVAVWRYSDWQTTIQSKEHTEERWKLMTQLPAQEKCSCKKLSSWFGELDWRAPLWPSGRCSEMDGIHSWTMATYMKLSGILPYVILLWWQSMRLAIECRGTDKPFTGCPAVPSTILTAIQGTKSSAKYNADYNTKLQCRLQCRLQC
jgi:hypothetical protein